MANDNVRK